jgi:benzoyl-CoA 2,3-dioxygenase component B
MTRIATFDDWVDYFRQWQGELGLDRPELRAYRFETRFGPLRHHEIEFGDFAGRRKWERVMEIPEQRIRDALEHLIAVQGDTELASVEQQRHLIATAPSCEDLEALTRVMTEEMRHGWQMASLLVTHFGASGRIEAQKLLERRAFCGTRLLGAFNEEVADWLDFFTYTCFIDRDGKYQLQMLSGSAFAPLARSMGPMLHEEAFHLGTGYSGLKRTLQAAQVPVEVVQRSLNKWVPRAFDLFGVDGSSAAHWAYVWGLKGRFDEATAEIPAHRDRLNEYARERYGRECVEIVGRLNRLLPWESPKLYLPDPRFNRQIGRFAGEPYAVDGRLIDGAAYLEYLDRVLPTDEDRTLLAQISKEDGWLAPKPSATSAFGSEK